MARVSDPGDITTKDEIVRYGERFYVEKRFDDRGSWDRCIARWLNDAVVEPYLYREKHTGDWTIGPFWWEHCLDTPRYPTLRAAIATMMLQGLWED